MPDYKNGKIYVIRTAASNKIYIGSTCDSLARRLLKHKVKLSLYKKGLYHYTTSYEIVCFDDCEIELLEEYPCGSKRELNEREGYWIRVKRDQVVNRQVAGRSRKDWRHENKHYCPACEKEVGADGLKRHEQTISHKENYQIYELETLCD